MSQSPTTSKDPRSPERIRHHYEVETELADRLRAASKEERPQVYPAVYNELFQRVPDHPQLTRKTSSDSRSQSIARQLQLLKPFLNANATFLEVGAGDCALSFAAAPLVQHVYAVDVSDEITKATTAAPANFTLILSDGTSIPVPPGTINLAYSNQLMEHLHPDDAQEQLENIYAALAPAGAYVCDTPNRLTGPHDVSRYFDETATGFHLREYSVTELSTLFRQVGFSRVDLLIRGRGRYIQVPARTVGSIEKMISRLKPRTQKSLARAVPLKFVLSNVRLVGVK